VPFSYAQYTGNGSTTTFSVPFPYLLKAHVKVYTGFNVLTGTFATELVDGVGFTWLSGTQVQTTAAPAVGVVLTVVRQTPSNALAVQWQDGSNLVANDLIDSSLQNLYSVQEQEDVVTLSSALSITAEANAATALGTANAASTTANGIAGTANTALSNSSAAVTTANAASATANGIAGTANTALSNSSAAVTTANAANTTANAANTTASGIAGTADTALTNANAAVATANAADATANGIAGTANTALSNSTAAQSTANTAVTNAAAAQGTANTAVTNAAAAQGTANTAVTNAAAAQSTANTAVTNAAAAQSTANTAVTNAAAAQSTANAALPQAGGTLTGNLTVPSLNGGPLAGLRNRIINGDMRIAQRGPLTAAPLNGYTLDRWLFSREGSGSSTVGQNTNSSFGGRFVLTASSSLAAGESFGVEQRIEALNCIDLTNQTVTVSFWANASTTAGSLGAFAVRLSYASSDDNWTSDTQIASTAFVPTGTAQKFTLQFSVPGAATTGLKLQFSGEQSGTTGTLTFGLGVVQLEPGSVATPFEQRPIGAELALCQRYFYNSSNDSAATPTGGGYATFTFATTMRAVPTFSFISISGTQSDLQIGRRTFYFNNSVTSGFNFTASAEL